MKNFRPKIFKIKDKQNKHKKIIVFQGLCKGCGLCLLKCPQKAISFSAHDLGVFSTPTIEIDLKKCQLCGICEINCPDFAIKVEKEGNQSV